MQETLTPPQTGFNEIAESLEPVSRRIRITRAMCRLLADNGLLTGRYELINGEIISKMGQNPPHMITVMLFTAWLMRLFGADRVFCQGTMDIASSNADTNQPEPDVMALSQPVTAFAGRHPRPVDILLLVEVSDSTLRFDLRNKAALYALAGIREYWVADIAGRRLFVHRNPGPNGYAEVTEYTAEAMVSCLSRPDDSVLVSALLPPVQP